MDRRHCEQCEDGGVMAKEKSFGRISLVAFKFSESFR